MLNNTTGEVFHLSFTPSLSSMASICVCFQIEMSVLELALNSRSLNPNELRGCSWLQSVLNRRHEPSPRSASLPSFLFYKWRDLLYMQTKDCLLASLQPCSQRNTKLNYWQVVMFCYVFTIKIHVKWLNPTVINSSPPPPSSNILVHVWTLSSGLSTTSLSALSLSSGWFLKKHI